jgi:hypothetical protein
VGLHAGVLAEKDINALDRVQTKSAQFTNHTKDSGWVTLAKCRPIARYAHYVKRTVGNGLGKLYETGCEGVTF